MRLALSLLLIASSYVYGQDELPPPAQRNGAPELSGFGAQVSYSLGLDLGTRFREDGVPIDLAAIVAGLRDGLTGAQPMLNEQQRAAAVQQLQTQLQQKAQSQMAQSAQQPLARGEAFLAENRAKEGVQVTASGLQYRVLEEGTGASPTAQDTVRCHYEGKLLSGDVFDSSYQRGEPTEFPVNGVIEGWTEALQMMKTGAKWQVFLKPDLAYGARGAGGAIGPNETLVFQIELLGIVE